MFANRAEIGALVTVSTIALAGVGAATGRELLLFGAVIVGFVVALPLVVVFGDLLVDDQGTATPLDALRAEYARGEIGREEFERRVEQLVAAGEADPEVVERMAEIDDLE